MRGETVIAARVVPRGNPDSRSERAEQRIITTLSPKLFGGCFSRSRMIVTTSYRDSMVVVMMCMQRSLDYALQSGYCGNDADRARPCPYPLSLIHAWHHGVIRVLSIGVSGYLGTYLRPGDQVPRHSLQAPFSNHHHALST